MIKELSCSESYLLLKTSYLCSSYSRYVFDNLSDGGEMQGMKHWQDFIVQAIPFASVTTQGSFHAPK